MNPEKQKPYNVAIVYHFFAHYRKAIIQALCSQDNSHIQYHLISDFSCGITKIEVVNPLLAQLTIDTGGLRWHKVKNIWFSKKLLWQSGLIKFAVTKQFDCIIYLGDMNFLSTWISALFARLSGKRVLFWTHGFYGNESFIKDWIRTIFYGLANGFLLYGYYSRNIMIRKGFSQRNLYVVYNSLDYIKQIEIRNKLQPDDILKYKSKIFINPHNKILCFIGRIVKDKKLDLILKAINTCNKSGLYLNCIIIGTGPQKQQLEDIVKEYNIKDQVIFYGECYDEELIARIISASDLLVSPGNVGLTAIHGLTYGTPVLTHDCAKKQMPEFESIIAGFNGDFFCEDNLDSLVDAIKRWFTTEINRDKIRYQCYKIIDNYYNPMQQVRIFNAAVKDVPYNKIPEDLRRIDIENA